MERKPSSSERLLKGALLPGTDELIASVSKTSGNGRQIKTASGRSMALSKAEVAATIKAALHEKAAQATLRTMTPTGVGKGVKLRLGGVKGEERYYSSEGHAKAALTKMYPKVILPPALEKKISKTVRPNPFGRK